MRGRFLRRANGRPGREEYRKMNPGPVEERIFFDDPSGRNRIHDAMCWKAENLHLFAPKSNH